MPSNSTHDRLGSLVINGDTNLTLLAIAMGVDADRCAAYDAREYLIDRGFTGRALDEVPRDDWLRALDFAVACGWRRLA